MEGQSARKAICPSMAAPGVPAPGAVFLLRFFQFGDFLIHGADRQLKHGYFVSQFLDFTLWRDGVHNGLLSLGQKVKSGCDLRVQ